MGFERTTGVVLRTRPLTETSLIVQWLTPDLGRVATVAKGARRPKSPFRGQIDLFYRAEFSFMRSAQMGTAASDRNNASILIPEAIDEIKRTLILSSNDAAHYGITSDHVGEFMDTVGLYDNTNPFA